VIFIRAFAAAIAAFALLSGAAVRAQEVPFNAGWQFQRLGLGGSQLADVTLPHTTRIEPRIVNDQWQGISVYKKRFPVPASWRGKTVLLRVEAILEGPKPACQHGE